jgi:hypothetical protein
MQQRGYDNTACSYSTTGFNKFSPVNNHTLQFEINTLKYYHFYLYIWRGQNYRKIQDTLILLNRINDWVKKNGGCEKTGGHHKKI